MLSLSSNKFPSPHSTPWLPFPTLLETRGVLEALEPSQQATLQETPHHRTALLIHQLLQFLSPRILLLSNLVTSHSQSYPQTKPLQLRNCRNLLDTKTQTCSLQICKPASNPTFTYPPLTENQSSTLGWWQLKRLLRIPGAQLMRRVLQG